MSDHRANPEILTVSFRWTGTEWLYDAPSLPSCIPETGAWDARERLDAPLTAAALALDREFPLGPYTEEAS